MRRPLLVYGLLTLVSIQTLQAQFPLPLYERQSPDEYVLEKTGVIGKEVTNTFDTVSLLRKNESPSYSTFESFHLIVDKECCSNDSIFLVGKAGTTSYADSLPVAFILGKINDGRLFDVHEPAKPDMRKKWFGDEWLIPMAHPYENSKLAYRWNDSSGNTFWQMREEKEYTREFYVRTFPVHLSQCRYFKWDSVEVLYCSPSDSDSREGSPSWTMVYVNGELLDAIRDYSNTTLDGYGPFVYHPQNLVGWYRYDDIFALVFSPGYVIYNKDDVWRYAYREAVKYYGECDCDE